MTNINLIGKEQLIEAKIPFIGCPSLAIPVLQKTYYAKFSWFKTKEELLADISKRKPLIILDNDMPVNLEKIPAEYRGLSEVYCIRAWESLPDRDWAIVRANICETDNHNFTFKWNLDNFSDPILEAAKKKKELDERNAKEYDVKELEEQKALSKMNGKRHPLLSN